MKLDDWVLCRIYNKSSNAAQRSMELQQEREDAMEDVMLMAPPMMSMTNSINSNLGHHDHHQQQQQQQLSKSVSSLSYSSLLESYDHQAGVGGGMYEPGVITNNQGVVPTIHMMGQSLSPHQLPSDQSSSTMMMMPLKRTLTSLYWPGIDDTKKLSLTQASTTSLVNNDNSNNNNNSCSEDSSGCKNTDHHHHHHQSQGNMNASSNLASAGDTPPPLQQPPSMLGPLSEGVFRQPYSLSGLNWFT